MVSVKNPTGMERMNETVELSWGELRSALAGVEPTRVVVFDAKGTELPSQVVYKGGTDPVGLVFQASVQPNQEAEYRIKIGQPAEYPTKAFGRLVPERKDDFAWENNLVVHRMYGPALEATGEISNGIDVWLKKPGIMVIDAWYKKNDYHKDHGDGLDCYKVGRTLGAGALAPYVDGKLCLGNNYITQQILDCGPLRISFKLTYAPFKAGEAEVVETRVITLDADSYFNKIEDIYEQATPDMEIAAGIVLRGQPGDTLIDAERGLAGYWEPQNNDSRTDNGHTAIGVIFPDGAKRIVSEAGHLLLIADYVPGEPFIYYVGTAWSRYGFETPEKWFEELKKESVKVNLPLEIVIKSK